MKTFALWYMTATMIGGVALLAWAVYQGERQARAYSALRRDVTGQDTPARPVSHILNARPFRRPNGTLEMGHKVFGHDDADRASHLYDAYCLQETPTR